MRMLRSVRLMLVALALCVIPASSYAGVFISVGFAPPVLPVYEQPICPEPGLMWTPGYWAYGEDGYYWVPGAWVPAPYEGALWTPGYWGWGGGLYAWHPGYWGMHVGYYGGVNYGFGYMGIGFAGGMWRGGVFAYNRAVMRVGEGGGWGGNRVYEDRTIVHNTTIINNTHVSYNGGPGGINHQPTPQENQYAHEQHLAPTSYQTQHEQTARTDKSAYFNNNHGHPATVAVSRPLPAETHQAPVNRGGVNNAQRTNNATRTNNVERPNGNTAMRSTTQSRPATESRPAMQSRPAQQSRPAMESRPAMQSRPATESRPAQQSRPAPQSHPAPAPRPQEHAAPKEERGHGGGR